MEDVRISKKKKSSLLGNFIIKNQWENQEEDRMTSGRTSHRS